MSTIVLALRELLVWQDRALVAEARLDALESDRLARMESAA